VPSAREQANAKLLQGIRWVHQASDETYGMPRIRAELADQSGQYISIAFGNRCKEMGVRSSMGTIGDAYGNAMAEIFCHAGMRAHCSALMADQGAGKTGHLYLDRNLVQPASPSFRFGPDVTHQLRKTASGETSTDQQSGTDEPRLGFQSRRQRRVTRRVLRTCG
jgi:hypothetical protein